MKRFRYWTLLDVVADLVMVSLLVMNVVFHMWWIAGFTASIFLLILLLQAEDRHHKRMIEKRRRQTEAMRSVIRILTYW